LKQLVNIGKWIYYRSETFYLLVSAEH